MIKHLCKDVPSNGERQMLEAASVTGHKDTDALYTFESRRFGGEIGLVVINLTNAPLFYPVLSYVPIQM